MSVRKPISTSFIQKVNVFDQQAEERDDNLWREWYNYYLCGSYFIYMKEELSQEREGGKTIHFPMSKQYSDNLAKEVALSGAWPHHSEQ